MNVTKIKSIQVKLVLFISLLVVLTTLTISWISYSALAENIKSERIKDVGLVANKKHNELVNEIQNYTNNAANLMSRLVLRCVKNSVKDHFDKKCIINGALFHIAFEKANGLIFRVASAKINWLVGNVSNPNINVTDFANRQLAVFNSRGSTNTDQPFYIMVEDKELDIQILVEYPLTQIQTIFSPPVELGYSGEVFLTNQDGYFVTKARYPARQGISETISAKPMQICLHNEDKEMLDLDYRLVPIIHGFRYIPEIGGGCIMAHIDQAEAFSKLDTMKFKFLSTGILFLLVIFILVVWVARNVSSPLVYLADLAASIARGGYNLKSTIKRDDEIGLLSTSFNQMTTKLLEAKLDVEKASALNLGIVNSSSDAIISISITGIIESCNHAVEAILGYQTSELIGQNIQLIMPEPYRSQHDYYLQEYLKTGVAHIIGTGRELSVKRKNGNMVEVYLKVAVIDLSGEPKFIGTLRDLRELKIAEAALKDSENKFRLAFSSIKDYAIIMLDTLGNVITWNIGAERIKGYTAKEIIGKNFSCFYPPEAIGEHAPYEILKKVVRTGRVEEEAFRLRKDGSQFMASIVITAVHDEQGKHIGFIKVVRDVTERKQLEGARYEAETANKEKSAFLASMSHEMRTPLNSIIGITELLLDTDMNSEQRSLLKIANAAEENLLCIINDTLDLSRVESGEVNFEKIAFLLEEQVKNCIAIVGVRAKEKSINLVCNIETPLSSHVVGDSTRIRQVILNLLSNAVKFSEGGSVTLSVKKIDEDEVDARVTCGENFLFAITDQGMGIPENKKELIFERFKQVDESITRKFGGSGLGLAISKKLVELMGGKIWVESIVGQGSTFYFTAILPEEVLGDRKLKSKIRTSDSEAAINSKNIKGPQIDKIRRFKILVADDSKDNRMVVTAFLKSQPYYKHEIIIAENGKEAIERFKETHFDLVLMDVQMPILDGYSATKEIREWEQSIGQDPCIIVAFTAHAFVEDIVASRRAGCNDHLTKPLRKDKLFHLIEKYSGPA